MERQAICRLEYVDREDVDREDVDTQVGGWRRDVEEMCACVNMLIFCYVHVVSLRLLKCIDGTSLTSYNLNASDEVECGLGRYWGLTRRFR